MLLISAFVVLQYDDLSPGQIRADVSTLLAEDPPADEFKKAYHIIPLTFPQDLGNHPDYQLEWWYYTGNLADSAGNRYGYQLTFFRRGFIPGQPKRESEWATHQFYFAHFTITDANAQTFTFNERFSRGASGLAGAQATPYHVWLDNWSAQEIEPGKVQLKAKAEQGAIDLILEQNKPPTLQGEQGLSVKSSEPGNASYYYSLTNNPTTGTITTPKGTFTVTGKSWKDHEWSTSALGAEAIGWDWFSVQLDDEREIMYGFIRNQDGQTAEQIYGGSLTYADGTVRSLTPEDVQLQILDYWESPHTGARYPAAWQLTIPSENIDLHLTPLLNDQELRLSTTYWEGAIKATGTQQGYGYIELTGYSESMGGRL